MSPITTPNPDHTPPSGYRTAESRPDSPNPTSPRDLSRDFLAKYIEDIANEYATLIEAEYKTPLTEKGRGMFTKTFRAGYARAREDFGL